MTPRRALSGTRAALWALLRERGEPTSLSVLASEAGLHHNTVREHLDGMLDDGLVTRHSERPQGRGRPAWLYQVAEERSEYAGLAAALASSIHRTSADPWGDAVQAGEAWGAELAGELDASPGDGESARHEVVDLLGRLGFAPAAEEPATVVRLTECPLLSTAQRYPDVVCGVHLGIVRGALDQLGGEPEGSRLEPFAEPGACFLHLS